ncbi:7,8-didemethyl-8-hydroxy-5-deazariboflavin synthase subunit CofH [Halioglobus maricola]|uniref:3-phospho-D-glycerate guanylyltransferase n=1 Tax=Halioglobus maricola TaxID=2601894 RepID=A0A5P9NNN6_9GAMM|nr:5-amino-6-(D-ribitylamino)uracil--L-tyrosine 4-hydroxyphenyl transferase CofH [Halioglobus maricola]QFU76528.1 7,8-didemethyl-8-hydroxy-5-deazariboflavin synthase subunit CofH [Halioglobus maricola]
MNKAHALVALKSLTLAKTRLAPLLGPADRAALVQAMAADVLQVLASHRSVTSVTLVSDDPAATMLAQQFGAEVLSEAALAGEGLNALLAAATEHIRTDRKGPLLVLHADLPLLRESDISAVLTALENTDVVIGSDNAAMGTNLLALASGVDPNYQFGAASCQRHSAWAESAGLSASELKRPGIGLDIDEPMDLDALLKCEHIGRHTAAWVSGSDVVHKFTPEPALDWDILSAQLKHGQMPSEAQALALAGFDDIASMTELASAIRDSGHGNVITYSRKVFIPLTKLCRDVCHYCTFAQTPSRLDQVFMPVEEVLELCREGAAQGCQEALFTLGEKPELRYRAARDALQEMGFATTLEYVREVARRVLAETGLLPHINAGCMTAAEIASLREVSPSMGIMLESASERLCERGKPHFGSPDKVPAVRLETMDLAGQAQVPFTSGILIGIGETRRERVESLLALRRVHERYGHLQEVIVQNFRAKEGTQMAQAPEPDLADLLWTIAAARLIFGPQMSIQAPPNLSPGVLPQLIAAGINDWGGVSPLTPDHVNPEAPWPHLLELARETAAAGKFLDQRLTIYPDYILEAERWLHPQVHGAVMQQCDATGFARRDDWVPGEERPVPQVEKELLQQVAGNIAVSEDIRAIVSRCRQGETLDKVAATRLFEARGADFSYVVQQANELRAAVAGDAVSYAVNRNINYTNVCYFKCQFCAFSKGKQSENLRGKPYDISGEEIARRCEEAWDRGGSEVCMQGGIHPDYTGQTYLDILATVRAATPDMHIHAFSPLEVWQGAETLGLPLNVFLQQLKDAGLDTLPGTAAEILHDDVRATLCPDKLNSAEWLEVMETAHKEGLRTTATIMYGHIEAPEHWAHHLLAVRELQLRTGGFTEFVPLPFVHMEAPMYLKGRARRGPTFREAVLMHAVSRLVLSGAIDNIQTSWVKMGEAGIAACLNAGANDLGGTLMNESITRAAGSDHGQEWAPQKMEAHIEALGRRPRMRTTLYGSPRVDQRMKAFNAPALGPSRNQAAGKRERSKLIPVVSVPVSLTSAGADAQVYLMAACD